MMPTMHDIPGSTFAMFANEISPQYSNSILDTVDIHKKFGLAVG